MIDCRWFHVFLRLPLSHSSEESRQECHPGPPRDPKYRQQVGELSLCMNLELQVGHTHMYAYWVNHM